MTDPSPGLKALRYAEDTLGVHQVYESALTTQIEVDESSAQIVQLRKMKRDLEEARLTRELDVQADQAGEHPGMSAAAFKEHMKVALHQDAELTALRDRLREVAHDLDSHEMHRESNQAAAKIAVARLGELGGYLNYLAAIKNQALTKPITDEEDPWK